MVQKENVLLTVETLKDSFTKTESRIASFVLENPKKVIYMSLTELSDALKVSEGSIVRFCQKAGFSGFHTFKIPMAKWESPA
jgi:DNA-binding MurR/RpiR family transcriptional regulator